jgi:hypothetical protein
MYYLLGEGKSKRSADEATLLYVVRDCSARICGKEKNLAHREAIPFAANKRGTL